MGGKRFSILIGLTGVLGCSGGGKTGAFDTDSGTTAGTGSATDSSTTGGTTAGTVSGTDSASSGSSGGPKLDVGQFPDVGGPAPTCKVVDDMDAVGECGDEAPPNSFEPEVQWTWGGTDRSVTVTPLVANLTDDNADGEIDLCDVPDIVVVADSGLGARIVVLDGATGTEHFTADANISYNYTPALGDIDGDGVPEIVAATAMGLFPPVTHRLIAFENDGSTKWTGSGQWTSAQGGAIAIADVNNDGTPEILADGILATNTGVDLFQAPEQTGWIALQKNTTPVAADLDGDDDLEIIQGQSAYQHDGSVIWNLTEVKPGYPQVANLDQDSDPEVLVNNADGITILEHDGTVKFKDLRPTGDPVGLAGWFRPSTIHDFDGDLASEFAVSSASHYSVFEPEPAPTTKWSADVQDGSGWAAGTAFDFLGDGEAEAMYADEVSLFIFNGMGQSVLTSPRSSSTLIEYPVVADVDNDGSAEIVVVSNPDFDSNQTSPAVQVIRDKEDRWIQARRIWNQHTYHVTNVREDGTIPQIEPKSWLLLNTYRTNSQIENGSVCKPPPQG